MYNRAEASALSQDKYSGQINGPAGSACVDGSLDRPGVIRVTIPHCPVCCHRDDGVRAVFLTLAKLSPAWPT